MARLNDETGSTLGVDLQVTEDATVISLTGDIDLTNASLLEEALAGPVGDRPTCAVIFDMAELQFMDSSALAVLVRLASSGTPVWLRSPSPIIREIISATGLGTLLPSEA
jgi:anti-anti-sigma factor